MAAPSAGAAANVVSHKLVLLGDTSVGKSCLVVRFCRGDFYDYQEPTIGGAPPLWRDVPAVRAGVGARARRRAHASPAAAAAVPSP